MQRASSKAVLSVQVWIQLHNLVKLCTCAGARDVHKYGDATVEDWFVDGIAFIHNVDDRLHIFPVDRLGKNVFRF